jgi:gamma-glutamyltranspeptidase/glutathione hydrolase
MTTNINMTKLLHILVSLSVTLLLAACSATTPSELSSKLKQGQVNPGKTAMVVTANPLASKAGAEILRAGGSAVDAAIAIEAVLSLVEPQSSGLGGGAYMLHFDNASNTIEVYDGRETAPALATEKMFLEPNGKSIGYLNAKNSGLSTGVPGIVSMLSLAHKDHGKLPWGVNFDRAKQLATDGFEVSPRLQSMIARFGKYIPNTLEQGPIDAYRYFFKQNGEPLAVGDLRTNLDYAAALDLIAADPNAFYQGPLAEKIVQQTSQTPRAGSLSLSDLKNYRAQKKQALCTPFKAKLLCGPPPSSSWVAVGQIMGLLENTPGFSEQGADDPQNWALFADAQRLAYADRDQYVADDQFVDVPLSGMLNPDYLNTRAKLISPTKAIDKAGPGNPWAYQPSVEVSYGIDGTDDQPGTAHFVVVDGDGNVVSMTASVESIFGSTRMAGGMFLNNQLTDFAFNPVDQTGKSVANKVVPNKRPRSSMSPTIVLDEDGEFLMATGSPGGNSIIAYTAKTLVGVLEWGLSPQQAIDLPNMVARKDKVRIEKSRAAPELISGLREHGFDVSESAGENSGFSIVYQHADGRLEGGVDPRREGIIELLKLD